MRLKMVLITEKKKIPNTFKIDDKKISKKK